MGDLESMIDDLARLNPYEECGRQLYQSTGSPLRYEQYIYLMQHHIKAENLASIDTAEAVEEQREIAAKFHELYGSDGLSEEDFFPPHSDIEVQQLLRYAAIPPHSHKFVECAFVLRGTCIHHVDKNEVVQNAGSFVIIPAPIRHQLIAVDDAVCLTIKIRISRFARLSVPNLPAMVYPLSFQCGSDQMARYLALFLFGQQSTSLPYRSELMELCLTTLITYILQQYPETAQPLYGLSIRDQKMLDIVNYMYNNYRTVTLREVADHFHYNEAYLSRMFHEHAGQSFSATVRDFRLRKAAELLKTTDWKIGQICESVGYGDTRQFIRSFKGLFGVTPQRYRIKSHIEEESRS